MLMITFKPLNMTCNAHGELIPPPTASLPSNVCHHPLVSAVSAFLQAKIVTSICHWKMCQLCVHVPSVLFSYFFPAHSDSYSTKGLAALLCTFIVFFVCVYQTSYYVLCSYNMPAHLIFWTTLEVCDYCYLHFLDLVTLSNFLKVTQY